MKIQLPIIMTLLCTLAFASLSDARNASCAETRGLTLQVLGSGGPIADDGRASSGYIVWVDGKSRFLIDAGGGVFLRFGEAGASFEDLEHIAISHLHTDHSTDLVALLKSGYFTNRSRSLSVSGPSAGGDYPGMNDYLERLVAPDRGAYAYLDGYLDGSDGLVKLEPVEVKADTREPVRVYLDDVEDIEIFALGVPHGPVPALAYRIRVGQKNIVFSGDQNGNSDAFTRFARDTDVLVMHMPVPENIGGVGRKLHAPPSLIGKIAAKSGTDKLVLSHFMARSLESQEDNLVQIQSRFSGPVVSADDLDCIEF